MYYQKITTVLNNNIKLIRQNVDKTKISQTRNNDRFDLLHNKAKLRQQSVKIKIEENNQTNKIKELRECSFKPKINVINLIYIKKNNDKMNKSIDVADRLLTWKNNKKTR